MLALILFGICLIFLFAMNKFRYLLLVASIGFCSAIAGPMPDPVFTSALTKPIPSDLDCGFYQGLKIWLNCPEMEANDYLINYGEKYCGRFDLAAQNWSDQGLISWTRKARKCLQEVLIDNERRIGKCPNLVEFAFDMHPTCYKEAGLCGLRLEQIAKIIPIIEVADIRSQFRRSVMQILNSVACWVLATSAPERKMFDKMFYASRYMSQNERDKVATVFQDLPTSEKKRIKYFSIALYRIEVGPLTVQAQQGYQKDEVSNRATLTQALNDQLDFSRCVKGSKEEICLTLQKKMLDPFHVRNLNKSLEPELKRILASIDDLNKLKLKLKRTKD